MSLTRLLLASALLLAPLPVLAQTAKPAAAEPAKADSKPDAAKADRAAPGQQKVKKPRSEAQKKNDERMRECGTEWRAAKAANKTGGKSWREFSTECRKKKKAA